MLGKMNNFSCLLRWSKAMTFQPAVMSFGFVRSCRLEIF